MELEGRAQVEDLVADQSGTHRVMFVVDDIEDAVASLRPHGAELVGDIARFEDTYVLCCLRGPDGP